MECLTLIFFPQIFTVILHFMSQLLYIFAIYSSNYPDMSKKLESTEP